MRLGALSEVAAPRGLILAAGRGERMRPLTDHCPKPLLQVRGQPLLQWWIDALARGGVQSIVINTGWLGEQIESHFDAQSLSHLRRQLSKDELSVAFSSEVRDFGYALETAGGIARALPLLAPQPQDVFWVVAGDIYAPGFAISAEAAQRFAASGRLAHLWLVPNPAHNPQGDFAIGPDGLALNPVSAPAAGPPQGGHAPSGGSVAGEAAERGGTLTFSTVALYRPALFAPPWCDILPGNPQGTAAPLAPLLRKAIAAGQVSAELYTGAWTDVGTPERLAQLNAEAPPAR